ncbi:MAG TPA: DoxX family protein [Rhizobium sp.]
MRKINWLSVLRWLLAAFFVFGGLGNIFASETILADYQRWGYPGWFHYVTGLLELWVAALLIVRPRHFYGAVLGGVVMLAAAGTVILRGEYSHAIAPLVVFSLCLLLGFLTARPAASSRR